jgi:hypothetical protein
VLGLEAHQRNSVGLDGGANTHGLDSLALTSIESWLVKVDAVGNAVCTQSCPRNPLLTLPVHTVLATFS